MKELLSNPKHLLFAPVYWRQGKRVKQDTPRLPEALPLDTAARHGRLTFVRNIKPTSQQQINSNKQPYRFMLVGDSSAAGVGVEYQSQALLGQLLLTLFHHEEFDSNYSSLDWQLRATSGHNSFDVLRQLYLLPSTNAPLDLLIVVVGVNDATQMQSLDTWQNNLSEILTVSAHKLQPKSVIFTALPPMTQFPAMPYPLNKFIGEKSTQLDQYLQDFCAKHSHLNYVDFAIPFNPSFTAEDYFASDGFHPSALTYKLWAEKLSKLIVKL